MGIKCFIRRTWNEHSAVCRSVEQAIRLEQLIIEERQAEVTRDGHTLHVSRMYRVAGGWDDDEESWQNRLEHRAKVHARWDVVRRDRQGRDEPRPYEAVRNAVLKSKQRPVQLEGSAAVSATPYRQRLKEEGIL